MNTIFCFALVFFPFWLYFLHQVSRNGEVVDHDLEQNLDIVFKKHLGLMDATELAQRQNSDPPLTSIDVFVPFPLEISDSKVLTSTVAWVNKQIISSAPSTSQIRFWTPNSQQAASSKQAVRMILEKLTNKSGVEAIIKLVSAPDCLFVCDMTLHTSPAPTGPVAFVNRRSSGVSEIFMQLSPGESSKIAAIWQEWRAKGTSRKESINVGGMEIEIDHVIVPDSVISSSNRFQFDNTINSFEI
jgi:hypothetical protein